MEILEEKDFDEKIGKSKGIALIDFYADWCSPCRMVMPLIAEVADELKIIAYKVNIDNSGDLATQFDIMSIPTIILFKDGKFQDSIVGAASKVKIFDWVKSYM